MQARAAERNTGKPEGEEPEREKGLEGQPWEEAGIPVPGRRKGSLGTTPPVSLTSLGSGVRGHICLSTDLGQQGSFPGCHWVAWTA